MKQLPPLSSLDQVNKFKLWLVTEVIDHNDYDINDLYELFEKHFNLMSVYKEVK